VGLDSSAGTQNTPFLNRAEFLNIDISTVASNIEFGSEVKPPSEYPSSVNGSHQYQDGSMLFDVLLYTPMWVFALLAGLVMFGLLQLRTRHVLIQVALALPIAMVLLSLTGVIQYTGWQLLSLSSWTLGLAFFSVVAYMLMDKSSARYDTST
jgi:hypothetical protein